jgi:hypothetical protein
MRTLSETSNGHALCSMLNHGNTLVQLLHCLSLSPCQLETTVPPPAQLLLSLSQQGDLVGHHLRLSNVFERISVPSFEPLYATNISHCKQESFLYEYCLPQVRLTTEMRNSTLPRLSSRWSGLLPSDTHRKSITSITAVWIPCVVYLLIDWSGIILPWISLVFAPCDHKNRTRGNSSLVHSVIGTAIKNISR